MASSEEDDRASARSEASYSARAGRVDGAVRALKAKLCHDRALTTKEHLNAARLLADAQRALEGGAEASRKAQIDLVLVCASLHRRTTRMRTALAMLSHGAAEESTLERAEYLEDDLANVRHTMMLVFLVVCTADVVARGGVPADVDESRRGLNAALDRSAWRELVKQSKRRVEPDAEIEENERQRLMMEELADRPFASSDESSSAWRVALAQPGALASAAMRVCGSMLATAADDDDVEQLQRLADMFARSTAAQFGVQLLKSDRDFIALGCQRLTTVSDQERADALISVVRAAESESGQQVRFTYFEPLSLHTRILPPRTHSSDTMSFHSSPS
jgi:hypothetical protein